MQLHILFQIRMNSCSYKSRSQEMKQRAGLCNTLISHIRKEWIPRLFTQREDTTFCKKYKYEISHLCRNWKL
ncbi:UNVERIFIED_CONTAM: hypothetical protein NCL1_21246 [Trichonephila clavipes]